MLIFLYFFSFSFLSGIAFFYSFSHYLVIRGACPQHDPAGVEVGKKNEEGPRCERVRLERVSMRVRHKHLKKMKKIDYECEAPINQYHGIIAPPLISVC